MRPRQGGSREALGVLLAPVAGGTEGRKRGVVWPDAAQVVRHRAVPRGRGGDRPQPPPRDQSFGEQGLRGLGDPVAVDETAVRINGELSWLYAAIDPDSELLLGVDLFDRRGTDPATEPLQRLTEDHDLSDTAFSLMVTAI